LAAAPRPSTITSGGDVTLPFVADAMLMVRVTRHDAVQVSESPGASRRRRHHVNGVVDEDLAGHRDVAGVTTYV
jgi:hypothetical protein